MSRFHVNSSQFTSPERLCALDLVAAPGSDLCRALRATAVLLLLPLPPGGGSEPRCASGRLLPGFRAFWTRPRSTTVPMTGVTRRFQSPPAPWHHATASLTHSAGSEEEWMCSYTSPASCARCRCSPRSRSTPACRLVDKHMHPNRIAGAPDDSCSGDHVSGVWAWDGTPCRRRPPARRSPTGRSPSRASRRSIPPPAGRG